MRFLNLVKSSWGSIWIPKNLMAGTSEEIVTCSKGNFKLGLSESKLLLLIKILIFRCLGGLEFENSMNLVLAGWMNNL